MEELIEFDDEMWYIMYILKILISTGGVL